SASQLEAAHASNPISLAEALREALADYLTVAAERDRLREEHARLKDEQVKCWALLGHTYADYCSDIPEALTAIAKRLQEQDDHAWAMRAKAESADARAQIREKLEGIIALIAGHFQSYEGVLAEIDNRVCEALALLAKDGE